jgi:PEP-CTERM motif
MAESSTYSTEPHMPQVLRRPRALPNVLLIMSLAWLGMISAARADILHGLGVMGDSGSVSSPGYKWPAQLQTNRGLNFGGSGLPYDHAVGGATSATLLSGKQNTEMASDVTAGNVTLGMLFIGNNDWGSSTGIAIANGTATPAQQTSFQNGIVTNIETAANTVLTAGIGGLMLGSVEDVTLTPEVASTDPDPATVARLQASVSAVNTQLLAYSQANAIPFVDFYSLGDAILAGGLVVGGVSINLAGTGSDPHDFWVDNLHPGIIGNAILGNMWMEAMNLAYGTNLSLYTDQQILALAGLSSSYSGETFSTAYNLANFIHITIPGDANHDAIVNGQDISLAASHWLATGTGVASDAHGDGTIHRPDIALMASHWLYTNLLGSGSAGGGGAVPEPATITLAALGALALVAFRRLR